MTSFYTQEELSTLGLKSFGKGVLISRKCSIYGAKNISIGDNVRIDDFCILSGNITIGSHIHISAYCALYGANGIIMENYTGLSPRCTLLSASDDFNGDFLIGPIHPAHTTHVTGGSIILKRYSQLGVGCTVLPSVIIEEGCAVGGMSLITKSLKSWTVYKGIPAKEHATRQKGLLKYIKQE